MTDTATPDPALPTEEIRNQQFERQRRHEVRDGEPWHNVGNTERIVGGALVALVMGFALTRRGLLPKVLLGSLGGALVYRSLKGECPLYAALGVSTAQQHPARPEDFFNRGIHAETSQVINAPADKLYAFWRDFSNLPQIMRHIKSVEMLTTTHSRWTAAAPLGTSVFWEAQIIHEVPNELISWRSVEHSDVENAGTVLFNQQPDGTTEVRVVLDYIPPAGKFGQMVAQFFGQSPEKTMAEDLARFKMLMETVNTTM